MDPGVENKSADRIVDVCRIAGKEYAPAIERRRDALVYVVQVAVNDGVGILLREELVKAALRRHILG